jgi:C-terminal processing protease CtpA/Prc
VIAWNVFQHFYPYFDVVEVDWDAELTRAIGGALVDESGQDFFYTLNEMVANLQDGHGNVYHSAYRRGGWLPLLVDWVEGRVVVTASGDTAVRRGDIIERIDGTEAERALLDAERFISGSPQWKRYRALGSFGAGVLGTTAVLSIEREGDRHEIAVERRQPEEMISEPRPEDIELLEDGIYYVDLARAQMPAIKEKIDDLAAARGVIFDLRGYPRGNHEVISYLLSSPDTSGAWMRVPQIIYPDGENVAGYQNNGWFMQVRQPHIAGTVVFLTDGRAISYAESFMGFIEGYGLAEIVGQPTAGTNGNVNPFVLPGGFRITWTGMKVVKHDGSQHHLIGIQPTVPMERTVQGVIDGRDEFLEKAIEIINTTG